MNKMLSVFLHEFRTNFRRRSYLITTFGVPIVLAAVGFLLTGLAGGAFASVGGVGGIVEGVTGNSSAASAVGMVDLSGLFGRVEPGSPYAESIRFFASEEEAQAALSADTVRAYYVIGGDYLESGAVTRYAKQFDLINSISDTSQVEGFLVEHMVGDIDHNVYLRLVDPANFDASIVTLERSGDEVSIEEQGSIGGAVSFVLAYLFAILIMMGTLFASGYLLNLVVGEKENRTIENLLSSVKPYPLLSGKVLAAGALGLLQIVVYMLVMWLLAPRAAAQIASLAGLSVPPALIVLSLVYFLGGFLMIGGFYAGIGAVMNRMQDAQQVAGFGVIPFIIPMFFLTQFTTGPNDPLPVVLSLFPITAPMAMVMRVSLTTVPAVEITVSLVLLAVGAVASIWFASRLFRINALLAGQAPRFRDLVRLVREE